MKRRMLTTAVLLSAALSTGTLFAQQRPATSGKNLQNNQKTVVSKEIAKKDTTVRVFGQRPGFRGGDTAAFNRSFAGAGMQRGMAAPQRGFAGPQGRMGQGFAAPQGRMGQGGQGFAAPQGRMGQGARGFAGPQGRVAQGPGSFAGPQNRMAAPQRGFAQGQNRPGQNNRFGQGNRPANGRYAGMGNAFAKRSAFGKGNVFAQRQNLGNRNAMPQSKIAADPEKRIDTEVDALTRKLDLSDSQADKIKDIKRKYAKKEIKAYKKQQKKLDARKKKRDAPMNEIKSVLNAEQLKKLEAGAIR